MSPSDVAAMAALAGEETGECYPGDTPWRRRFVELMAAHFLESPKTGNGNATERESAQCSEINALREALAWYAEPSNWKREVRDVGPRINWTKPPAAFDRGARALFVLMTLETK